MRRRRNKDCFTDIEETLLEQILRKLKKLEDKLMATREELNAKIQEAKTTAQTDIAQVAQLVQKALDLIERIGNGGTAADFAAEVAELQAVIDTMVGDNAAIQAALDAPVPPTPPTP